MSKGKRYIALHCACGHESMTYGEDWPEGSTGPFGVPTAEALARLRCSVCGRRGRPERVIVGWNAGGGGWGQS